MGYRILVAEDEDASRTEIERILSKQTPHEILTAGDGQQPVELARGTSVDLLITDVRMPRKSGIDALREILSFTPSLMGIVITGFAGEEAPIQALKLGAKDYLNQPINAQELLSSVERLITIRMLEDEARRLSESLKLFQAKIEEALSIAGATSRVSSHASLDEVLQHVAKLSQDVTGAERVGVWLLEGSELVLQHDSAGADVASTLSLGEGIAGRVAATGQVLCGAGDLAPAPLPAFEQGHRCTIAQPLRVRENVVGVLELFGKNGADFFGKVDLEILGPCGELAAIAIADNRKDSRVNTLLLETLQAAVEPTVEGGQSALVETIRPAMEEIEFGQALEAGALEVARLIQQIQAHGPDAIAFCGELLSRFHDVLQKRSGASRSFQWMSLFDAITPDLAWGDSTGKGVRVAVVDSGVDTTHPSLKHRIRGGIVVRTSGHSVSYEPFDGVDSSGHGTACAGIISRLAPHAEIWSVKVLGADCRSSEVAFLAGLRWAVEQGFPLVNLSLGTKNLNF